MSYADLNMSYDDRDYPRSPRDTRDTPALMDRDDYIRPDTDYDMTRDAAAEYDRRSYDDRVTPRRLPAPEPVYDYRRHSSPVYDHREYAYQDPYPRDRYYSYSRAPPAADSAPRKPVHAPRVGANPVLGVFGLSIRTRERDLEDEFTRYGDVEKVVIVYDQRTDRSRGFGFITMRTTDDAARCVDKLNGFSLHGRQIRVDFSATQKPHNPTPGEYMGIKRPVHEEPRPARGSGDRYDDRRDDRRRYDDRRDDRRDERRDDRDRDRDRRDRDPVSRRDVDDPYGGRSRRDERDRRRSPSPRRRHSASPDRRVRDYDAPPPAQAAAPQDPQRY